MATSQLTTSRACTVWLLQLLRRDSTVHDGVLRANTAGVVYFGTPHFGMVFPYTPDAAPSGGAGAGAGASVSTSAGTGTGTVLPHQGAMRAKLAAFLDPSQNGDYLRRLAGWVSSSGVRYCNVVETQAVAGHDTLLVAKHSASMGALGGAALSAAAPADAAAPSSGPASPTCIERAGRDHGSLATWSTPDADFERVRDMLGSWVQAMKLPPVPMPASAAAAPAEASTAEATAAAASPAATTTVATDRVGAEVTNQTTVLMQGHWTRFCDQVLANAIDRISMLALLDEAGELTFGAGVAAPSAPSAASQAPPPHVSLELIVRASKLVPKLASIAVLAGSVGTEVALRAMEAGNAASLLGQFTPYV